MRTKTKLLVAALGFVTAVTGVAVRLAAPPRLENAGQKLPFSFPFGWLGSEEVLSDQGIYNLRTQKLRPLPLDITLHAVGGMGSVKPAKSLSLPATFRETPLPSPDGKWLLYPETVMDVKGLTHKSYALVHPDGSELRRIPVTNNSWQSAPLWLPDSSGWLVWNNFTAAQPSANITLYSVLPNAPKAQVSYLSWPIQIQTDGRFLFRSLSYTDSFRLCERDSARPCESVVVQDKLLTGQLQRSVVSPDSKTVLISRSVPPQLPEQGTWEVLLKRKLPVAFNELWLVARDGSWRRCLVREPVREQTYWYPNPGFSMSFSPDSKKALVSHYATSGTFVLSL